MSPHYEDAAHLLRFLVSSGMPLPRCTSHHTMIQRIAGDLEAIMSARELCTDAEAAQRLLSTIERSHSCLDRQLGKRAKLLAIIGTTVGNLNSTRTKSRRRIEE